MAFDAASLIANFKTAANYAVTRRAAASVAVGRAVAGSTTPVTIVAVVVPSTPRDLLLLPEGRRAQESLVLFTTTALLVGGQGAANECDLVSIGGRTYEVQHVETWPGYYRAIVVVTG